MLKNVHLTEINAFKGACHNVLFQFGFWQLGVPIGSLFHKKLGPYFKAWGVLISLGDSALAYFTILGKC